MRSFPAVFARTIAPVASSFPAVFARIVAPVAGSFPAVFVRTGTFLATSGRFVRKHSTDAIPRVGAPLRRPPGCSTRFVQDGRRNAAPTPPSHPTSMLISAWLSVRKHSADARPLVGAPLRRPPGCSTRFVQDGRRNAAPTPPSRSPSVLISAWMSVRKHSTDASPRVGAPLRRPPLVGALSELPRAIRRSPLRSLAVGTAPTSPSRPPSVLISAWMSVR